jgi:hypothetical protein
MAKKVTLDCARRKPLPPCRKNNSGVHECVIKIQLSQKEAEEVQRDNKVFDRIRKRHEHRCKCGMKFKS